MRDEVIELIVEGQKEIRDELKEIRDELVSVRLGMAFDKGQQKGRAGIIGAASGFASALLIHIFGPAILSLFHFTKK